MSLKTTRNRPLKGRRMAFGAVAAALAATAFVGVSATAAQATTTRSLYGSAHLSKATAENDLFDLRSECAFKLNGNVVYAHAERTTVPGAWRAHVDCELP